MKVLSIGSDRNIFDSSSAVAKRLEKYAARIEELHTVVFSLKNLHHINEQNNADKVFAYPTKSSGKFRALIDAVRIGKRLISDRGFSKDSDVITVQDPFESGLVGLILSVVTGLRLHVQIHTDLFSPHFVFHSLLNFVRVVISIPVILGASSVRVVSSRIANRWPSKILINQDRLAILPIFVPGFSQKIDFKASGENLSHGAIISVARLEPEKDWETAISVFAKVVKVFPEQKFFIYGSGGCGKLINSLVQSLGLSDKVVLKGWLGSQEEIYRDASILLVTSKYEGFGMVYIEAALNYVPIVSTEVGIAGIELLNERDMLTAPVADIDGLASNIIRLLKDRDLYKKIAAQAHTSVLEKFNTDEEVYLNNIVKSWSLALKN